MSEDREIIDSAELQWHSRCNQVEQMTHKSGLEVPTPAVVEKTNKHGSQEITNQQCDVGCHGIRYDQPDELLQKVTQFKDHLTEVMLFIYSQCIKQV